LESNVSDFFNYAIKYSAILNRKVMKRFRFLRNRDRRGIPSRQEYRLPVSASLQKVIEERKVHAEVRYEKNEVSYTSRRSPTFLLVAFSASIWFSRLRRRKIKPRLRSSICPRLSRRRIYAMECSYISCLNSKARRSSGATSDKAFMSNISERRIFVVHSSFATYSDMKKRERE